MKAGLEFVQNYRNLRFFLEYILALILCSGKTNTIQKIKSGKQNAIIAYGPSCINMVFAILAKPIVLQM